MVKNKVILITGTSRGFGQHLAAYYAHQGMQVIGCSRKPLRRFPPRYRHFRLDITDEANVKDMFARIGKDYTSLDVLINNAGITSMNHVLLTPIGTMQNILNTNVTGTFLFCREAAKLMRKHHYGRIVNISSIHVPLATVGSAIYSASKAAVEQFSQVFAKEVAPFGITVNTLGLSLVKGTGMVGNLSKTALSTVLEQTAFKTQLDFNQVVQAMDFFISTKSQWVNGQKLYL